MSDFKQIASGDAIKEVIKSAFDTDLALSGAWGYTKALTTVIEANQNDIPLPQLEHMITSMRAYLEMNMTQTKEERYGSINVNEISREQSKENGLIYDKVTYEIPAMKEDTYAAFINEYKEGYGTEGFDLNGHFKRRKEATLTRVVTHWFEVSKII
jgi:hypothetical protein